MRENLQGIAIEAVEKEKKRPIHRYPIDYQRNANFLRRNGWSEK